ncbi:putative dioxygenase subunit alpha YeaW [Porphyridium purpureum]|uniref:Choline monooxygenase, chloroplastic n=1 Tax=Porphyridium purpureum TaxID=35688 RepID=A0A5J4YZB9_PORPP|nr:putative dioxygenase subunit alpha YeaW [Porphyridium purpureum]|eukprot:POR7084..scf208_2
MKLIQFSMKSSWATIEVRFELASNRCTSGRRLRRSRNSRRSSSMTWVSAAVRRQLRSLRISRGDVRAFASHGADVNVRDVASLGACKIGPDGMKNGNWRFPYQEHTLKQSVALPPEVYAAREVFEIEKQTLWRNAWQFVTHESELLPSEDEASTESSTFKTFELLGYPLVAVRDGRSKTYSAFHNVCRHRAGPLEWPGSAGCLGQHGLRCKYHGWMYDLNGQLRAAPNFGDAAGFRKSDYPLLRVDMEQFRGFLLMRLIGAAAAESASVGHSAKSSFRDQYRDLVAYVAELSLERFKLHGHTSHHVACNWKVMAENYLEGYHIPTIHPALSKEMGGSLDHYEVKVHDGFVTHHIKSDTSMAHTGLWVYIWPNAAINMYKSGLSLERWIPVDEKNMRVEYLNFFDETASSEEISAAQAGTGTLTQEDANICEAVQQNLNSSGVYSAGRLSPRHEMGVHYFQSLYRANVPMESVYASSSTVRAEA